MKTVFYLVMQSSTISFLGEIFALISQIQKAREKRGKSSLVLGPREEPHSREDVELSPLLQQADPSEHGLFCYIYNDKYLLKENPKDACDYVSDLGVREDFPG